MRFKLKYTVFLTLIFMLLSLWGALCPVEAWASDVGAINTVSISLSMPVVNAADTPAIKASTSTSGCYISPPKWFDSYGQPVAKFTSDIVTLELTVQAYTGYYFSPDVQVYVDGESVPFHNGTDYLIISKSYYPVIWAPDIVKHPGDETVAEGEMASFVAYGSCVDKSTWMVLDSDGMLYPAVELMQKYPGVLVSETFDKLNVYSISRELDGFKFKCCFTGPGGAVDTNFAKLTVQYDKNSPSIAPVATPTPTPVAHDHVFAKKLSQDAGYHWYACECGEAKDKTMHDYIWTQIRPATADTRGHVQGKCQSCGYIIDAQTQVLGTSTTADDDTSAPATESTDTEVPGGKLGAYIKNALKGS